MQDFDKNIDSLLNEYTNSLYQIERAIFTEQYNLTTKHFEILSVHSIAMIYSLWEGFIQKSFQYYIDALNKEKLVLHRFTDRLIVFHMEKTFTQFYNYPTKDTKKVLFFKKLYDFHKNDLVEFSRVVNTESNVGFDVLNKLLSTFSLEPFDIYWKKYTHPNPNLKDIMKTFLDYRNGIAHGNDISSQEKVTRDVFEKYKNLILNLMDEIYIKMTDGLNKKTYLCPFDPHSTED